MWTLRIGELGCGGRSAQVCVSEHDRYGRGSVMVWADINVHGKKDVHFKQNEA